MKDIYKTIGIYRITNKEDGMSYIGKTGMNFGDRWDSHRALLRAGKHDNRYLQNAWNKYGEECFEFVVVESVENPDMLNDLEIKYIAQYKSNGLSYNLHDGGDGGYNLGKHLSESTKRKIGEKNRLNMLGKKASEATKKKMSESHLRRYKEWTAEDRAEWGRKMASIAAGRKWSEDAKRRFSIMQREHPNGAKLTPDDIRDIRAKRAAGATLSAIAGEYNTSSGNISNIVQRKRWAYID